MKDKGNRASGNKTKPEKNYIGKHDKNKAQKEAGREEAKKMGEDIKKGRGWT